METIELYYLLFMIYSMIGWVWESVFCSLWNQKRLTNRGFLNGPYCPIYGWGALLDLIILGHIENPFQLFLLSGILSCTLEYATSYVMEKLFHARWWDYSNKKFNLNGRIYLNGFLAFGAFAVLLIKILNPFMVNCISMIPQEIFQVLVYTLFIIYLADNLITFIGFTGFNERLKELTAAVENAKENVTERIHSSAPYEAVNGIYERFSERLTTQQRRMIHSFPKLQSIRYNQALKNLRKFVSQKRKKEKKSQ